MPDDVDDMSEPDEAPLCPEGKRADEACDCLLHRLLLTEQVATAERKAGWDPNP